MAAKMRHHHNGGMDNCRSLDAKLIAYCAMAGGALAVAAPADATVVYSGIKNLGVNSGNPSVWIDIDNNTTTECQVRFYSYFDTKAGYKSMWISCTSAKILQANNYRIRNLAKDDIISKTQSPWSRWGRLASYHWWTINSTTSTTTVTGNFLGKKGFVGVRFTVGPDTHYGWIQFQGNDNATAGTVIDWAYETQDNASIKAGDNGSVTTTTTTTAASTTTTTTQPTTTTTIPVTPCTVTVTPAKISKLFSSIKPIAGFFIRGDKDALLSRSTVIDWGTGGVKTLFQVPLGKRALFAVVLFKPVELAVGDTYDVHVGDCTGTVSVK